MDATLTRLTLATAELAAALHGAPGALAPRLAGAERDATALREQALADDTGTLTAAGVEWFQPLREPTYVFRIERSVLDLEAAQSFYVHLPTLRCVQVVADGEEAYALTHLDVADVIYAGLLEAAGIWPDTHPELDPDAPPPEDAEEALTVTLVVLHAEDDGFTEHELSWLDLDDDGLWLIEDGKLTPTSDYALYQRIPPLLHVLDR
jgi:hypothetical protein